jgi:hypothetical protein
VRQTSEEVNLSIWTEQRRDIIITSTDMFTLDSKFSEDSRKFLSETMGLDIQVLSEIWTVTFTEQHGLLPPRHRSMNFDEEEEAQLFFDHFKTGGRSYHRFEPKPSDEDIAEQREILDSKNWSEWWGADTETGRAVNTVLPKLVLDLSGIINSNEEAATSTTVLDFLGVQRVAELKKKFPRNWRYVAEFEYAALEFSEDSPAYIAAAVRYCRYISKDLLVAGYLIRDLEILISSAESRHARDSLREAGSREGSRENISEKLRGRWRTLVTEMAKKLQSEIDANSKKRWTELSLARFAAAECVRGDEPNWRVGGAGSVKYYLTSIRAGEGGEDLKAALQDINIKIKIYLKHMVKKKLAK